jgi:glycosyltransferase involved in cell wall biosynthesis
MNTSPIVSVIMIFLNGDRFMVEAIESICAQTHKNWELLLVDDGSTDGSAAIGQRYVQQRPQQVRCLHHPGRENRGMSASRNLGLAHARGEYVAFLDADDVWLPDKLAEQVAIMERHPEAGMVYGRTLIWYSWTGKPEDKELDHTYDLGVLPDTLVQPPVLFHLLLENKAQTPTTCNALMRHEVVDAVGGFEESFRGLYEDQVFFAKVHLRVPVYVAGACWARYRQHAESCTSPPVDLVDYYVLRRPLLKWLVKYLERQGISRDSDVWRALRKEMATAQHPHVYRVLGRLRYGAWWVKRQVQKVS